MKKNYFFAMLFALAMVSLNAQFVDDMESYPLGPVSGVGPWLDWGCGGGAGCAIMADNQQSHTGVQSGYIPTDGTTDAVLNLDNKIFGTWGLQFFMYVPTGKEGYWNLQGTVPIGAGEWTVGNIYFNIDGLDPGRGYIDWSDADPANDTYFDFPHDAWFEVVINVDISLGISAATWQFGIDGVEVVPAGTPYTDSAGSPVTSLGGIDFFSINAVTCEFWVDDFTYQDSFFGLGVSDLEAKGFSAFPNPVNDVLNLQADEAITSVAIHNLLGQEVYRADLNALNSTVDMSSFARGAYFVTVSIGASEGTIKIVK